ncbi:alpha/beta hydrolase [Actibacterium lipolyticum]|uniref:Monoterpene epsilon-lactone hydrolase n=1 Tax=Actibacterium lipolyticum TaxID=1524263 RepID=A0A238JM14_9RHOB|nr:alpha/beta hydrolase [Actibacterium lipolyticum]SMX31234.1 Monoterpene epsilon-lactone hydrolase [Actibacterium lipolyticum]
MSVMRAILNPFLRLTEKPHLARATPEKLRSVLEKKAPLFFRAPRGTLYEDALLQDGGAKVPALWAIGPGADRNAPVVLYFHGGGYVFGSPNTHKAMLARLSSYSGMPACLPKYRLAPEHPFPAAIEDALTAYKALQNHPAGVVLGGDSAGGGLALALLGEINRLGLVAPLGCFAFSPLTDLTFSSDSLTQNAAKDVVLPAARATEMAQMYLNGHGDTDPRVSPLHAAFAGAPPVWLTVADAEILLDDTQKMAAHLRNEGVETHVTVEQNLPHVWPLFHNILPEARHSLRNVAQWLSSLPSR